MKDHKEIRKFHRVQTTAGLVSYSFGTTTIIVDEWEDQDGDLHLRPVAGYHEERATLKDLTDDDVAAYCEMIEDEIRRRKAS